MRRDKEDGATMKNDECYHEGMKNYGSDEDDEKRKKQIKIKIK